MEMKGGTNEKNKRRKKTCEIEKESLGDNANNVDSIMLNVPNYTLCIHLQLRLQK